MSSCVSDPLNLEDTGDIMFTERLTAPRTPGKYDCPRCGKSYRYQRSLKSHLRYECGKKPRFGCPYCHYVQKIGRLVYLHIERRHPAKAVYAIDFQLQ